MNKMGYSKPKYICRRWMKTRIYHWTPVNGKMIHNLDGSECWNMPCYEFYCPTWAKPLDFIWKLIFGKPQLVKD